MTVLAKEIIKDKFWIMENNGEKIATLSHSDDKFIFNDHKGTKFFRNQQIMQKELGEPITWQGLNITQVPSHEIHDHPTSCVPYNILYDVQKSLPLFTKSTKSKSLYCAGYYIIKFNKGWVKSFCPKLLTLEKYVFKGPFKTKIQMKDALGKENAKRENKHISN